ncbi:MAG: sensor histidine kinase [Blastocatellia bacterium]
MTRQSVSLATAPENQGGSRNTVRILAVILFAAVTVMLGIFNSSRLAAFYQQSVAQDQQWSDRLTEYLRLGDLAAAANAPGNDVFNTKETAAERKKLALATKAFREQRHKLEVDNTALGKRAMTGELTIEQAHLENLALALTEAGRSLEKMAVEAEGIFTRFSAGDLPLASQKMALMDQQYEQVRVSLEKARYLLAEIRRQSRDTYLVAMRRAQWIGNLVAAMVILLIAVAGAWGLKINRKSEMAMREREQNLAQLRQSQKDATQRLLQYEYMTQVFNAVSDPIFVKDEQRRHVLVNDAWRQLMKYSPGQAINAVTPETSDGSGDDAGEQLVFETGEGSETEETLTLPDGEIRTLLTKKSLFINSEGRKLLVGILRDITERKQAEEKLLEYTNKLKQSNRELEDFATVASHDLQEPLRKVQAFADRLGAGYADVLGATGKDYLERMRNAARRMQTLVNDMLTLSRVTTQGREFTPVELSGVVRGVVSDLEIAIEQSGGQVENDAIPVIDADPAQMRQMLQNLIGNSLKFQRPDIPPVVRVSARVHQEETAAGAAPEGEGRLFCELRVADNGIGFDEKYLDRIFTVFQRLHTRDKYEGTGVGLSVCRRIAERHGGTITAESAPDQGAVFIVTLPLRHGSAGRPLTKTARENA